MEIVKIVPLYWFCVVKYAKWVTFKCAYMKRPHEEMLNLSREVS